ncbi:MAG: TauD/TfdA family dioxygenase [Paracoccaceae bacterium]|nr:TauD/TfdA family dioxygenase [Paracoccaceae bacterium]
MESTRLHPDFGVSIAGVDLNAVTAEAGYPEIRAAFEEHSVLLFPNQHLDDEAQLAFARLFGPLEDRIERPAPKIAPLSNRKEDGSVAATDDMKTLSLKANQLWHTDSTFLPVPALANVLQARTVTSTGGETEFASTRAGWQRLTSAQQDRARGAFLWHRFSHSRARIDPDLARQPEITKWKAECWRAVWPNPVNGAEAIYVASHAFAVEGMDQAEGAAFIDELIAAMTPPEAIYTHRWSPGDVLLWDERATLHRGLPWPYAEERTLVSICVTATPADGLATVSRDGGLPVWPAR